MLEFFKLLRQHQDVVAGIDQQGEPNAFREILPSCGIKMDEENSAELTNTLYLCIKLYLWRCRSPEAISHAICWRIKGSIVSESACRQLCR